MKRKSSVKLLNRMIALRKLVSKRILIFVEVINQAAVELNFKPVETGIKSAIETLSRVRSQGSLVLLDNNFEMTQVGEVMRDLLKLDHMAR